MLFKRFLIAVNSVTQDWRAHNSLFHPQVHLRLLPHSPRHRLDEGVHPLLPQLPRRDREVRRSKRDGVVKNLRHCNNNGPKSRRILIFFIKETLKAFFVSKFYFIFHLNLNNQTGNLTISQYGKVSYHGFN